MLKKSAEIPFLLGVFAWVFLRISSKQIPQAKTPYRVESFFETSFYKHAEETPKQINLTGLKRVLKSSRFPRRIRFGVFAGVFLLGNRTYRAWYQDGYFFKIDT